MKCEECESLVEEYIDGELSDTVAENVEKHIGRCHACARFARDLRSEQQLYGAYEQGIEVTPQLWAGIETRIGTREVASGQGRQEWLRSFCASVFTVPRFSGWATAVLVLIAIGATALVMEYMRREQPPVESAAVIEVMPAETPTSPVTNVTSWAAEISAIPNSGRPEERRKPVTARSNVTVRRVQHSVATKTPNQLVYEAEQKYIMAIAMLSRDATRKRSQIDPATRARLDQAIASIDRTIAGTRQAVRQHPGDPVAVQYMLAAYSRKVDLLRDIAAQ